MFDSTRIRTTTDRAEVNGQKLTLQQADLEERENDDASEEELDERAVTERGAESGERIRAGPESDRGGPIDPAFLVLAIGQ